MAFQEKVGPTVFEGELDSEAGVFERLKYAAACKLCTYEEHEAATGSVYVTIDNSLQLRFADHEAPRSKLSVSDFVVYDFVNRDPTEEELQDILDLIDYPHTCKKTILAMHVGLTVPRLKKLLTPHCYNVVNEVGNFYGRTRQVEVVAVREALDLLQQAGIRERKPIRQETYTVASQTYC